MLDGWNVHTPLSVNTWQPLDAVAPIIDEQTLLATVTVPVVFRGTLTQLKKAFRFGSPAPSGLEAYGIEPGMLCRGPSGAKMISYTEGKPHWMAEVEFVGISAGTGGSVNQAGGICFTVTTSWARRETEFPQEARNEDGSTTWIAGGYPFTPNSPHPVTGLLWSGIRLDHVPAAEVRFVLYSAVPPHPGHPSFAVVRSALQTIPLIDVADYSKTPNRTFVTWAGGGSGPGQSAPKSEPGSPANTGQWCVANVSPTRCIAPLGSASSVKAIHVGTALFDYQPLRQIR